MRDYSRVYKRKPTLTFKKYILGKFYKNKDWTPVLVLVGERHFRMSNYRERKKLYLERHRK